MELKEYDLKVLKKFGFNKKEIQFLLKYLTDNQFEEFLNNLKRKKSREEQLKYNAQLERKLIKNRERNFQAQCKCNFGAVIIQQLFLLNYFKDYDEIVKKNTNVLTEKSKSILKIIIDCLNENLM